MATICCKNVTFNNVEAILFDKDGTLADSESFLRTLAQRRSRLIDAQIPGVQEPLMMAFGVDNTAINPAGLMAVGTRQENEIAAAAYVSETGRNWLEALAIVRSAFAEADRFLQPKADHTPLFSGALKLVQTLAAANLKLGILSSDSSENVKAFSEKYQLSPYLKLHGGTDGLISKPNPVLFQQACESLGVAPENTLMIGDSQADIDLAKAAKAAGCVGVTWGWSRRLDLIDADSSAHELDQIQVVGD